MRRPPTERSPSVRQSAERSSAAPARVRGGAHGARRCLGLVVTLSSAACAPSPDPTTAPPAHATVEYYRAHTSEREAALRVCTNDPGGIGRSPACVNARTAAQLEAIGSLADVPPLFSTPTSDARGANRTKDQAIATEREIATDAAQDVRARGTAR